jgi:hypothetical protein
MKRAMSLRRWAFLVIELEAVIALLMMVLWVIADVYNLGVPILPVLVLWGACALMTGGVLTLVLDGILRLTGRRF